VAVSPAVEVAVKVIVAVRVAPVVFGLAEIPDPEIASHEAGALVVLSIAEVVTVGVFLKLTLET
jgi:hypothetical protein